MSTPSGCELAKLFSDSYLFQSVLLSHLTASLITLFFCYIGLKNFRGALFHWNCKILIITLFGCYIVHAISLIVTFGYHLFVFNFRSHCDMLVSGLFCHLTRGGANVIMIGSSYIHLFISFERLWAKYMDREYHEQNGLCGVISLIVILIFTLCTYIFFVRKDNLSDMTPYCSSVNKYTLNDSMIQAYCMLGVDFISTLIMASLHFFSWHENQRTHPRSYDLRSSFARVEHQASTSFLFPLTVLHCIVYILFSIFNLIIMNLGAYLDFITFRTIFSAVLLPPYHILLSSLLFIYLLRERKKKKVENLQSITRKVTNQREILMTYARDW